jgi:probable rRNA maturation factor
MGRIRKSQDCPKPLLHKKTVSVHIDNHQKAFPIEKRFFSTLIKEVLSFLNVNCKEISIYFTTEEEISKLHDEFFQDPTPTDCISFPLDDEHLGEVFVCPSVALDYAKKHDILPIQEVVLYVIHGILHLIGYDDMDPKSKKIMRAQEKKCMNHIQFMIK